MDWKHKWLTADANKCVKIFLNKERHKDGIGHCAETWIAFFFKQPLVHNAFKLCTSIAKDPNLIFIHDISSYGPPKVVRQSLSSCMWTCIGEDVGHFSQHESELTMHCWLIGGCTFFDLTTCSNFWLTKIGCTVKPDLKLTPFICLLTTFAYISS